MGSRSVPAIRREERSGLESESGLRRNRPCGEVGHPRQRIQPHVGQSRASGYEGEGYAIVRAPTTDEAVAALRALVTNIRVVLG